MRNPVVHRLPAPTADLCQPVIFRDFNPPALSLSQVPVESVHLVHGQEVDVFLDKLFGKEMAADIKMDAPPDEPGPVFDLDKRDLPGDPFRLATAFHFRREKLEQRLDAVEEAGRSSRFDLHPAPGDGEL